MTDEVMGGFGADLDQELLRAHAVGAAGKGAILVEGTSDKRAVDALARRRGRNLDAEGVITIPTAGATNILRFLEILGPHGHGVALAGLCDAEEEGAIRSGLAQVGMDPGDGRAGLEQLGFFVCVPDLEDELIRALTPPMMVQLIESQGQLRRFRRFQSQPAQRHKDLEAQLHRWLGNHKIRYAPLMIDALDLERVPRPLDSLVTYV